MSYELVIKRAAEKQIARLPGQTRKRVVARILRLSADPYEKGVKKLIVSGHFRARAGDYRISYLVDDRNRVVTVDAVRHRREAYR